MGKLLLNVNRTNEKFAIDTYEKFLEDLYYEYKRMAAHFYDDYLEDPDKFLDDEAYERCLYISMCVKAEPHRIQLLEMETCYKAYLDYDQEISSYSKDYYEFNFEI